MLLHAITYIRLVNLWQRYSLKGAKPLVISKSVDITTVTMSKLLLSLFTKDRKTGRQGDKETGRQGDKETGRQGNKKTGRQGDRETR